MSSIEMKTILVSITCALLLYQLTGVAEDRCIGVFPTKVEKLSLKELKALSLEQISNLSVKEVKKLSPQQISEMDGVQLMALPLQHLRVEQITYFTSNHVSRFLNEATHWQDNFPIAFGLILRIHIQGIRPSDIPLIRPEQIKAFSSQEIRKLSAVQIERFLPNQIQAFGKNIVHFSASQFQALGENIIHFSASQFQVLGEKTTRLTDDENTQRTALYPEQIKGFTHQQINLLLQEGRLDKSSSL